MQSKTKIEISELDINKIFKLHFSDSDVKNIIELNDGCFNMSYLVATQNNMEYVLKISPSNEEGLLTYEQDMMFSEVEFHNMVSEYLRIPVPHIVARDFSKSIISSNYFIMNKLPGYPLNKYGTINEKQREQVYTQLAKYLAYMHNIKGDCFGYKNLKEHFIEKDYFESYKTMVDFILKDADKMNINLPVSHRELLLLIDKYDFAFKGIKTPVFVHYDLWDGNIFVNTMDEIPVIEGLIDFERGFYADPAADFSQVAGYIDLKEHDYFIKTYNMYSQKPFELDSNCYIRIKLFRLYLFCIMIVESYYRDVDGSYNDQLKWAQNEFIELFKSLRE